MAFLIAARKTSVDEKDRRREIEVWVHLIR